MTVNRDLHRRDTLLGISGKPDSGGIVDFTQLDAARLELLLAEGFADPDDAQNEAPTIAEFQAFLQEFPEARLGGYAVVADRPDYRVSITTLVVDLATVVPSRREDLRKAILQIGKSAAELETNGNNLRAWWD